MKSLNIIGCGKVGKTLGFLWHQANTFEIRSVANRNIDNAKSAVEFINDGDAINDLKDAEPADIHLIGCADNHIHQCCNELVNSGIIKARDIVFHCSGALTSSVLNATKESGALVASVHPVKSFANPAQSIHDFSGTYCGIEGDPEAISVLQSAFKAIGAETFQLNAENKTLYHAASVIACNYLVALEEISLQTFEYAGVDRKLALKILEPMVKGTTDNIFNLLPAHALTGPIARGDHTIVENQLKTIANWNDDYAQLYRLLGKTALDLAHQQKNANEYDLDIIDKLLQ